MGCVRCDSLVQPAKRNCHNRHIAIFQFDLPRILVLLSLLATNDTSIGSTALHAALKKVNFSVKNSFERKRKVFGTIKNLASSWSSSDDRSWSSGGNWGPGGSNCLYKKIYFNPFLKSLLFNSFNDIVWRLLNLERGKRHRSIPRHQHQRHGHRWRQSGWSTREWCLHRWWYIQSGRRPCS